MSKRWLLPVVVISLVAAPATAQVPPPKKEAELIATGGKRVTPAEFRQLVVGNTVYSIMLSTNYGAPVGTIVPVFYRDDKNKVAKFPNGQKYEGLYWIDGDKFCGELKAWDPVAKAAVHRGNMCYTWYHSNSVIYVCPQPAGVCDFAVRTVPGNPEQF